MKNIKHLPLRLLTTFDCFIDKKIFIHSGLSRKFTQQSKSKIHPDSFEMQQRFFWTAMRPTCQNSSFRKLLVKPQCDDLPINHLTG